MPSASSATSSALNEIGWDEGISIPVANVENKILEDELQKGQQQLNSLKNELSEHEDRVSAMHEHLKNVRQELQATQAFHGARKKQQETEEHMTKLAEREVGRLKQEIDRLQKELNELKDRENVCENNKFRLLQRLEDMKSQMNWDQQALQAWLEESAHKDEDAMIIEKYSRQDEYKIKELSNKIGYMVEEALKKKRHLDQEYTETLMAQLELDKTGDDFRQKHAERQELLSQWQQTIEQMQKRDEDMDMLALHLGKLRLETRNKEAQLKEKEQFYENEIANNKEFDTKITLAERNYGKIKQEYQDTEHQRDVFNSDLEVLKRTVDRTASDLEAARAQVKQMKRDYLKKQEDLKAIDKQVEALKLKLDNAVGKKMTAEERSIMLEATLKQEQSSQEKMQTELRQLGDIRYRRNNELFNLKTQIKNLETDMQGMRASIRNYNSKIVQLDQDSLKQMEIVYSQDFNIQSVERRIGRMRGERTNEETVELEAKIRELTKELEGRTAVHNMLTAQIKRLHEDVRKTKFALERVGAKKANITEKIADINLQLDNAGKESKRTIIRKQDLMVEANILKLEVKRLRDKLYKTTDGVVSLERNKMEMETAMKERQHEITVHIDMLNQQIRAADSERHNISAEVHERITRIDKLKKRFEIMMVSMAPPEGEEERSQAYYVIKAAQEKEDLQREGDILDANIRKSEKEIRALENTLRLLNSRNDTYRRSQKQVDESSDEMEQKQQMEEQLRAYNDKKRYKKRQIRELQEDLQVMQSTMDNLSRDGEAYNETIHDKQNKISSLKKEIEELECKLDRAAKMNLKIAHVVRPKSKEESPDECDFEVRVLCDLNHKALKHIAEAIQQCPEIGPAVHLHFTQAKLPLLPAVPSGTSGLSSRASSSSTQLSVRSLQSSSSQASVCSSASSHGSTKQPRDCGKPLPTRVTIGDDLTVTGSSHSAKSSPASSKAGSARSGRH